MERLTHESICPPEWMFLPRTTDLGPRTFTAYTSRYPHGGFKNGLPKKGGERGGGVGSIPDSNVFQIRISKGEKKKRSGKEMATRR